MGVEKALETGFRNTVSTPLKNIANASSNERDVFSKPGAIVAETLKEGLVGVPLRNIGAMSNYFWKKSFSVLGSVLKTGAQAAMLIPIPLPLPGGMRSAAEIRGSVMAVRQAVDLKSRGQTTESFSDLVSRIRGVRDASQEAAMGQAA